LNGDVLHGGKLALGPLPDRVARRVAGTILAFPRCRNLTEVNNPSPPLFDLRQQGVEIRESNEAATCTMGCHYKKGILK
jgi:hypothetical protein